jgi:hypothetical protein
MLVEHLEPEVQVVEGMPLPLEPAILGLPVLLILAVEVVVAVLRLVLPETVAQEVLA